MSRDGWLAAADRSSPWHRCRALVAGLGASGFAAADALLRLGADVMVCDASTGERQQERATVLETLGAVVRLGEEHLPGDRDLVVVSPGLPPGAPIVAAAASAGVPVWSGEQLAWRLRPLQDPAPWLVVTGTNGKTTTTQMLTSMLRAAGLRAVAAGNIGVPLVDVVTSEDPPEVIAVELSSFQLHFTTGLQAHSAALLNVEPDHLDWHGSYASYAADKARVYTGTTAAVVYNVQAPVTEQLAREADVAEGCRGIGFTLGIPEVGMVGIVDDALVDRAFVADRSSRAAELASVRDVRAPGSHNVANALAAAALARSFGVGPRAVRDGLRAAEPPPHRSALVATHHGVAYLDDSKATNPHAAAVSLGAHDSVVWIAGGVTKDLTFEGLVASARNRLRGVVLIGEDRRPLRDALRRHAPDVPVIEVEPSETDVMVRAVRAAAGLAQPGDTVLLAPACASMDQFRDYAARGDAFVAAVRHAGEEHPGGER